MMLQEPLIKRLPLIRNGLKRLDQSVRNIGFQKSMLKLVQDSGTKLTVFGKTDSLKEILQKKPVVLASNRPFYIDPIVLIAGLEDRKDIFSITNSYFTKLSSNLDKYLIPVYIRHHLYSNGIGMLGKLMDKLYPRPIFSPEEEHFKNIKSIKKASIKVSKGGLVVIFPTSGRKGNDKRWFKGIGYLIDSLEKETDTYFVMANIEENYNYRLDFLRLIPKASKILPRINITFSKAYKLNQTINPKDSPTEITLKLEKKYKIWAKNLPSNRAEA